MWGKKKVFTQLVKSYILFAAVLVLSFGLCLFVTYLTSGLKMEKKLEHLLPAGVVGKDGELCDTDDIVELGGWIELLDRNYHVVQIIGDKTDKVFNYTLPQLFELTGIEKIASQVEIEYKNGVYSARPWKRGGEDPVGILRELPETADAEYILIKYPASVLSLGFDVSGGGKNGIASIMQWVAILFFVLFTINIFGISFWLNRKIKQPLGVITEGILRVKNGEENVRINLKAQLEFEEIGNNFNTMVSSLETVKKEKEMIEQQKRRMFLDLSHDIKTPIATIKSYATALSAGMVQEEEKKQIYLDTIDRKSERVSHLVDEMFDYMKLESTDYSLSRKDAELSETIREILLEYYEEIEEKGFFMEVELPEEEIICSIDQRMFARMVSNLIINCLKYNSSGTTITIILERIAGNVCLSVKDNGCGIPKEVQSSLFEPFVRGDSARRSDGGSGLGLAIARKIAEKHGGTLELKQTAIGCCFEILIK